MPLFAKIIYTQYSTSFVRQPSNRSITEIAKSCGIQRSHKYNGNNIKETYTAIKETFTDMRVNGGPSFLEFSTYRWLEHCGPNFDNHIGYRTEQEFSEWKDKDPIENARKELKSIYEDFDKKEREIINRINHECSEAFDYAMKSPYPQVGEAYNHIYASQLQKK